MNLSIEPDTTTRRVLISLISVAITIPILTISIITTYNHQANTGEILVTILLCITCPPVIILNLLTMLNLINWEFDK